MKKLILFIALMLVFVVAVEAREQQGFIVIGDSISAGECSWARLLQHHGVPIMLHAQPGRSIAGNAEEKGFTLSEDLKPWGMYNTAIVYISANDVRIDPNGNILYKAQNLIDDLVDRGFKVIFILPPIIITRRDWDTYSARLVLMELQNATIFDPSPVHTLDGIHPTCEGHIQLAGEMAFMLWFWTFENYR